MYKKLICLACFVLVLGFVSNASAELVGHWRFDEGSGTTANDQSGNGNDGTLINDPVWAIGINNGALQFDGIDDYVNCGNDPSLNVTDAVTIAAWVKLNSVPPAFSVLIAGKYGAYWLEWRETTELSLSMFINGAYNGLGPTLDLADGDWHHIALTYDGTNKKGYYDRQEVFSEAASGAIDVSGNNFLVGEGHPASSGYNGCPDGLIDDVQVYNRALTQEEIQLMMQGKGYPLASGPAPKDGDIYENTWVSLGWKAGDFAVSHDVYMGDNFDDVNDGTRESDVFQGNQGLNSVYFVAGFAGYAFPDGLVNGNTYYWRIDEVNDADPNSPWKGKVWSFWIPSKKAYVPVPSDGSKFIDAENPVLTWTPGFGSALHTVYFGDDFDTVANATDGPPQGITNFSPGPLELGKTYFWRVDEFDENQSTHTGDVWSFTTVKIGGGVRGDYYHWNDPAFVGGGGNPGPGQAFTSFVLTREDPQINFSWGDGSPDQAVNVDVFSARWTGEVEAAFTETYTFYTSTDDGARLWINGQQLVDGWIDQGTTEYSGEIDLVAGNSYSLVMEYYENGGGAVAELRWSSASTPKQIIPQAALALPVKANSPSPSNGATGTNMTPILSWGAGDFAASHEVYFGTDANAVKNATTDSPEYKGPRALGDENYDPGKLARFTEYFWRVDEVNNLDPDSPWIGNLWSFTTGDFIVVDDVEGYSADNPIWENWLDGIGYGVVGTPGYYPGNGTGSAAGDDTVTSTAEENIVHGGGKAMPVWYNNIATAISEIELTLSPAQDWTANGLLTLSLWFYGDAANVPGQLYVKVNGVPVLYDGDASNLTRPVWQVWNINLSEFGALQNVTKIVIGVQNNGATGKLIFDDIRLYALDRQLITPVQPDPAGLVAQYAFDGNANDSAGSNHGTLQGNPQWVIGYYGNALAFDGLGDWVDCGNDPSLGISGAVSVTAWINIGAAGVAHKVGGNQDGTNGGYKMGILNDKIEFEIRTSGNTAILNRDVAGGTILEAGVWYHVTGIYSQQDGYIRTYVNGLLDRELLTNEVLGASPGTLYIGCEPYDTIAGNFNGVMDDIRIYNRVLSDAEIAGLAGRSKPFDKPF